jgi:hypothetical protein
MYSQKYLSICDMKVTRIQNNYDPKCIFQYIKSTFS